MSRESKDAKCPRGGCAATVRCSLAGLRFCANVRSEGCISQRAEPIRPSGNCVWHLERLRIKRKGCRELNSVFGKLLRRLRKRAQGASDARVFRVGADCGGGGQALRDWVSDRLISFHEVCAFPPIRQKTSEWMGHRADTDSHAQRPRPSLRG